MKLQILVPQYNESDAVIKPLLDSIAIQQCVDFADYGVIIVNDGSNVQLTDAFLRSYPFQIQYILAPHKGVSGARNVALDHATAEYVMFCDADDMFFNACGLWIIEQNLKSKPDTMTSIFTEQVRRNDTGEMVFVNREMDSTFVHGKVHKLAYLKEKNIRFCERLTVHEDSYFNVLAQSCTENLVYCKAPFYLWKWRDDSICRHDDKYILKTYGNLIDSSEELVNEFERRDMPGKADRAVAVMFFDAYYTLNKPAWINQANVEYRDATERRFYKYYLTHRHQWERYDPDEKMRMSVAIRNRTVREGMQMEHITFDDWLKRVERTAMRSE